MPTNKNQSMTPFKECRDALGPDFNLVDDEKKVLKLLQTFHLKHHYMAWESIEYKDYDCMKELLRDFSEPAKTRFYVLADNENIVIELLFPSYTLRVGQKMVARTDEILSTTLNHHG